MSNCLVYGSLDYLKSLNLDCYNLNTFCMTGIVYMAKL